MLIKASKWEKQQKEEFQGKYEPFSNAVKKGEEKGYGEFNDFAQDLYSSLYQISPKFPQEEATSGKQIFRKALDEMKELPEFKHLRDSGTKCDSFQSGLGASILSKKFAEAFPKAPEEENPDNIQKEIDAIMSFLEDIPEDSPTVEKLNKKLDNLQKAKGASEQAWGEAAEGMDPGAIRQTLRRGLAEAKEEINEAEEDANAFGYGSEPGQDGYSNSQTKLAVAERIRSNPKLKEIAKLAGRFRREALKQHANKKKPGPDELTDVEVGNDLGRILPSEAMKLGDENMEYEFFKKYLERSLLQYRLDENVAESKGPIVVCIDNSGSMSGYPEIWSKAIFLGLADIALKEKREIVCLHYSSSVDKVFFFDKDNMDPLKLLEAAAYFSGGGTKFYPAFQAALSTIENSDAHKKADIIFITDGNAPLADNEREDIEKRKKATETRIYTIAIGASAPSLEPVTDTMTTINDLRQKDSDKGIKETLFSV